MSSPEREVKIKKSYSPVPKIGMHIKMIYENIIPIVVRYLLFYWFEFNLYLPN